MEEILVQHPAVEQCAVVGKPDHSVGEAPVAFVKLRAGAEVSTAGKVLKRELRERLRQGA